MKQVRRHKFKLKNWQLFVVLVPLLFIDATLLRFDHIHMTELRDAVMTADEGDDDNEIADRLIDLKEFVFHNIVINVVNENGVDKVIFGTGPFYLEHQYLRAATAALELAKNTITDDSNPNGNVYALASETCKAEAYTNGWSWDSPGYINCMMSEIGKYPAMDEIQDKIIASLPSTELYRHNYASPIWAPTLTGFMILITLIIIVVIIIRIIIWIVFRITLHFV